MAKKNRKNTPQRLRTRKAALPLLCWALLALAPCGASPVQAGEDIAYTGGQLATPPETNKSDSLFSAGSVSGNTVTVGAHVPGDVYGGIGAASWNNVSNNTVIVKKDATVGGDVYGGWHGAYTGKAGDNTVLIDGTVEGKVYGGFAYTSGTAQGNSVSIGQTGHVRGDVYGGKTSSRPAMNNTVETWGTVDGSIYGGASGNGDATGNRIVLHQGSVVGGTLYGGYSFIKTASNNTIDIAGSFAGNAYGGSGENNAATHNTIILREGADVSRAGLFGGFHVGGLGDIRTGNTLLLDGYVGTVREIGNFENYYFLLPASVTAGSTILAVTGGAQTDMRNSTIGVGLKGGGPVLKKGDTITLIHNANGVDFTGSEIADAIPDYITGRQGISLDYTFGLAFNDNKTSLVVEVTDVQGGNTGGDGQAVRVNPQVRSLLEGRAAALSLLNQGADLLATSGMEKARAAARDTAPAAPWTAFAALSSATSRIDSGSDITLNSLSLLTGFARDFDFSAGEFLLALFGEAGFGSYWSRSQFQGLHDIAGKGYANYLGAGLAGRLELLSGLYAEASFRAGQGYFNFTTDDLRDACGASADYDARVPYHGAHAGLGYIWNLSNSVQADLYGNYFWTHLGSANAHVAGDPFSFDAADSRRIRAGTRVAYTPTPAVSLFAGAAYEHEFSGNLHGTTYGFDIPDAPSLRGDTGRGELGIVFRPGQGTLAVELGLQGTTGAYDSIGGMLQVSYSF